MTAPVATSPWYNGVITGPDSFNATGDFSWLAVRAEPRIAIHNGAVCVVEMIKCMSATNLSASFKLLQGHGVTQTPDLYFATTDSPVIAGIATSTTVAAENAPMTSYPPLPSDGAALNDGLSTAEPYNHSSRVATRTDPPEDGEGYAPAPSSGPSIVRRVFVGTLLFGLLCVLIVIHSEITLAIAVVPMSSWLNILYWVFLGAPAVTLLYVVMMYFVLKNLLDDNDAIVLRLVAVYVWTLIFVIALMIPYAWAHAQAAAADRLTDGDNNDVSVNCFQWMNTTLSRAVVLDSRLEFIYLEEPTWRVNYEDSVQKIFFDKNDDDAIVAAYCVAPIVYRGLATTGCANRLALYATCYSPTPVTCSTPALAALCGWTLPANGVALRVINKNEEFYGALESTGDVDGTFGALGKTPDVAAGVAKYAVAYGGISAAEVEELGAKAVDLTNTLRGVIYGVHFILSLLYALQWMYTLNE